MCARASLFTAQAIFREICRFSSFILGMDIRVVKTDQLFQNSPSKPSNSQPSEGLLQTFFILKAITTSCLIPKSKNCHWGKYKMKYLTSPNMTISFFWKLLILVVEHVHIICTSTFLVKISKYRGTSIY